ncbi:MAG TPA: hypothetical protein VN851_05310 [Thermoanaerobaculia bacterium]|nr:hypothetical protein [Thermoanaerobaculia bacterium]
MPSEILILTQPGDIHAAAVAEALKRRGASPELWYSADFPHRSAESIRFRGAERRIAWRGPQGPRGNVRYDTVWRRRPAFAIDPTRLDPADVEFAQSEVEAFRHSILSLLAPEAFWVNAHDAARRASRKPLQHALALEVGLNVPDTLYGNDPEEIRAFLRDCGGQAIYKPFRALPWVDGEAAFVPYTAAITERELVADELLLAVPGIYQALVPKAYEIRLTMIGRHAFAARLSSQETVHGRLDWRRSYAELKMEPWPVPADLAERCAALLDRLGLVFGAFDFIVSPDGALHFLEVNEMGQFLFLERYAGLPLLDAFAEFLIQGRVDFDWRESDATLRYADLSPAAEEELSRAAALHTAPAEVAWNDRAGRAG